MSLKDDLRLLASSVKDLTVISLKLLAANGDLTHVIEPLKAQLNDVTTKFAQATSELEESDALTQGISSDISALATQLAAAVPADSTPTAPTAPVDPTVPPVEVPPVDPTVPVQAPSV